MRTGRVAQVVLGWTLILLIAGCSGAAPPPAAPPGVTSEPAPPPATPMQAPLPQAPLPPAPASPPEQPVPEGFYSQSTRTGVAEVDRFLDALRAGKTETLFDQYQAVELPCAKRPGMGAPLCPNDTPAGTTVKAYPYAWCDVAFMSDQRELKQYVTAAFRGGQYLFAVYRTGRAPGLDQAAAAYAVVLAAGLDDTSAPTIYLDKDGNLVLVRWGCGATDLAVPAGADLVLAPKVTASADKRSQAENGLSGVVEGEVRQMYTFLRGALDEVDPCAGSAGPCVIDTNFASVVAALLVRCDKVGPEAQMNAYAYDEKRHGPVFRPYKAACDALRSGQDRLGEPQETPSWRKQVLQARQLLEPAVQYLDAAAATGFLDLTPELRLSYALSQAGSGAPGGTLTVKDAAGRVLLTREGVLRVVGLRDAGAPVPVLFGEIAGGGSMGMYYEAYLYSPQAQRFTLVQWARQPFGISRSGLEQHVRSIRTTYREAVGSGWKQRFRDWSFKNGELTAIAEGDL